MAFLSPSLLRPLRLVRIAAIALLASGPATSWATSRAEPEPPAEFKIKAAFLLNFAGFVEWPPGAFASAADPIVIGIYGADPFGVFLDRLLESEMVCGRTLVVRRFAPGATPAGCHILFISESEARSLGAVLQRVRRQPVLTVSNLSGFTQNGGMIQLLTERGRIRFQINQRAAESVGLTLSSRLLRLSRNPVN